MNKEADVLAYVKAAAALHGLAIDEGTTQRVAEHLSRTALMARSLDEADLGPEDELAEIYKPAAFPEAGEGDFFA